jgi:transposase, IS6 family
MAVGWYLRFSLSYRDVEKLLQERGMSADHVTAWRWVQRYAPELDRRHRSHLKPTNKSWRVDETYIRVKGKWTYLYRAVDSAGASIDFLLSARHDAAAAKRFFQKALSSPDRPTPRVINVDKIPSYPPVVEVLKSEGTLRRRCQLRPVQYLNNILEQDHRAIKRRVRASQGFRSFWGRGGQSKVTSPCMRVGRGKPSGWSSVRLSANSILSLACSRSQSDPASVSRLSCPAA